MGVETTKGSRSRVSDKKAYDSNPLWDNCEFERKKRQKYWEDYNKKQGDYKNENPSSGL